MLDMCRRKELAELRRVSGAAIRIRRGTTDANISCLIEVETGRLQSGGMAVRGAIPLANRHQHAPPGVEQGTPTSSGQQYRQRNIFAGSLPVRVPRVAGMCQQTTNQPTNQVRRDATHQ